MDVGDAAKSICRMFIPTDHARQKWRSASRRARYQSGYFAAEQRAALRGGAAQRCAAWQPDLTATMWHSLRRDYVRQLGRV